MKILSKISAIVLIVSQVGLFYSCEKEINQGEGELNFMINKEISEALSLLKNAEGYSFSDVRKVVITIKHADGRDTEYNSSEFTAYSNSDGSKYIQRIGLSAGDYQLTEFLLIDNNNSILYAAPMHGSPRSRYSQTPLPLDFTISANQVAQVKVYVLSTEDIPLESFGLTRLNAEEAETIKIRIGIMDSRRDIFVSARVWAWSYDVELGEYIHSFMINSNADNLIELCDGYEDYTLNFVDFIYDYGPLTYHMSNAEIKAFADSLGNEPWIITLQELSPEIVFDADGNVYESVTVCGKTWMTENLKTSYFDDFTPILQFDYSDSVNISGMPSYKTGKDPDVYGYYYNWAAVNSGKLAPEGWHVATVEEWNELCECSEGAGVGGGKLKENGLGH